MFGRRRGIVTAISSRRDSSMFWSAPPHGPSPGRPGAAASNERRSLRLANKPALEYYDRG